MDFLKIYNVNLKAWQIARTFSAQEWIDQARQTPERYIHYCEIVILPSGRIMDLIGSHQTTLESFAYTKTGIALDAWTENERPDLMKWWSELLFSISPMCWVRYDFTTAPNIAYTPAVFKSVSDLKSAGFLSPNIEAQFCHTLADHDQFLTELSGLENIDVEKVPEIYRLPKAPF